MQVEPQPPPPSQPPPGYQPPQPQPGWQPQPTPQYFYPPPPPPPQQQQQQQQQTTVVNLGGTGCQHVVSSDFTCCGICCAIFFFPIGLIFCFLLRERRCSRCGARF